MICPEPSELQELVRDLHRQATPWLPAGLGSRLTWGPPVPNDPLVLSTARLQGIRNHNPGDFTITVAAGTPLVELQAELAHHRQWLAVDWPWGSGGAGEASGSIGGLVARGLAGGLRQRYLGVRDQLIGIELLRTDGTPARAGGQVVKNVAGYDLMRLLCGSWGSLALITAVTLRSQPLPPQRRGLWLQGPNPQLAALASWLLGSNLSLERLDWQQSGTLEPGLLISLASISAETLNEQIAAIRERARGLHQQDLNEEALRSQVALGQGAASDARASPWLLRLGVAPDQLEALLQERTLAPIPWTFASGTGLGLAWAEGDQLAGHQVEQLRRRCIALGGHLTVLRQPPGSGIPAWLDAPSRPLIEAVKRQFDPKQQLARGRLPGVQPPAP